MTARLRQMRRAARRGTYEQKGLRCAAPESPYLHLQILSRRNQPGSAAGVSGSVSGATEYFATRASSMTPDQFMP